MAENFTETNRYGPLPMRKLLELTPNPIRFELFALLYTLFTRFDVYVRDTRAKVGGYKSRVVSIFREQLPKIKREIRDHYEFYTNGLNYIIIIYVHVACTQ